MTALYTALVPIMPMPPIHRGSSYGMMSLPLTEWISGALSRSESARNSFGGAVATGAAHDHDAACLIDPARDFSDVGVARGKFGSRLQGCHAYDTAVPPSPRCTSCGSVRWATPRPA